MLRIVWAHLGSAQGSEGHRPLSQAYVLGQRLSLALMLAREAEQEAVMITDELAETGQFPFPSELFLHTRNLSEDAHMRRPLSSEVQTKTNLYLHQVPCSL